MTIAVVLGVYTADWASDGTRRQKGRGQRRRLQHRVARPWAAVALSLGIASMAAGQASTDAEDGTPARPNIVVILSDDMGWGQVGFNGGTEVATPNIDRISDEGVKLTQFYVQPSCTPTRASFLTGRYNWKNGTHKRIRWGDSHGVPTDERTLAEALGDAGYATWIVGKWDQGSWHTRHLPLQRGFDHHYGMYAGSIDSFTHRIHGFLDWHRNARPVLEPGYSTFLLAEEARQLIGRHDGRRPFFLYLAFNAVHKPHRAPGEYVDLYPNTQAPEQRGQLKAMDVAIGRVLDGLSEKGVLDDTLVMFFNDNGGYLPLDGNGPYRGLKTQYHEGGIRVPAAMRWPARIPAGSVTDALLDVVDLFPTFAGLANADTGGGLPLDGVDAWEAIANGGASPRTEVVHSLKVIRVGDWKLIDEDGLEYDSTESSPAQLYNLAQDPYETTNRAGSEPGTVAELRARLAHHAQFARSGETSANIPIGPREMTGEAENEQFGDRVRTARNLLYIGTPFPLFDRLEAVGREVTVVYTEALEPSSVPDPDAFRVVVKPGYAPVAVEAVALSGKEVRLTLAAFPGQGKTLGLTYDVPDTDALVSEDDIEVPGLTWATATIQASRAATLSALALSGVNMNFASATTNYEVKAPYSTRITTVVPTTTDPNAAVTISPGAETALAVGENEIEVTVTAEDGTTTKTYTVTVTRTLHPIVSIRPVSSHVSEGEMAAFRVSRTGSTKESLNVSLTLWSTKNPAHVTVPVRFGAGDRRRVKLYIRGDDRVVDEDIEVVFRVEKGDAYTVSADAQTAVVVMQDNDIAEFSVSFDRGEIAEGEWATASVAITNGVTYARKQVIAPAFAGSTATKGTDFTVSPGTLTLGAGATRTELRVTAQKDRAVEDDETVSLEALHDGTSLGSAALTITDAEYEPLTAAFSGLPALHDGETVFPFELNFSEAVDLSNSALRTTVFDLTGGSVATARRVTRGVHTAWKVRIRPASDADVVIVLPGTTDCAAAGAVCTVGGIPLSNRIEATVRGPAKAASHAGFTLAAENGSPGGLWSDGHTAWVSDVADARLYAYRLEDGGRLPGRDIATEPAPMGLWSDGHTLWSAQPGAGVLAYRLGDGARLPERDLAPEPGASPVGVWSDGATMWVSSWLDDTVRGYRHSDGARTPARDIGLAHQNLLPLGLWSDGQTLWVADWAERMVAYRLSDGAAVPDRSIGAGVNDEDPTGLWANAHTLLSTSWEDQEVIAYRLPSGSTPESRPGGADVILPPIPDPALRGAIEAALGEASREGAHAASIATLESLKARHAGITDLTGLEAAVTLKSLDLGFNPLQDLGPLTALPHLRSLNLDGAAPSLATLPTLARLLQLSVRHNGLEDLRALAGFVSLKELDVGDNGIGDLGPLAGLVGLTVLRADHNRIADIGPLASLAGLETLHLDTNRLAELRPLAGMAQLRTLQVGNNPLAGLYSLAGLSGLRELGLARTAVPHLQALSGLVELRRLDLRGTSLDHLYALDALPSLDWLHVGGSRIDDPAPPGGVSTPILLGRDDLQPLFAGQHVLRLRRLR